MGRPSPSLADRGSAEITAVDGASRFQSALRGAAAAPRPWRHRLDRHLPAVVARDPKEPATVAVLIDGNIVGYLNGEVAERHREQLQEIEHAGQHLVCSALIVGGEAGKHFGVRLQIKPDIGRRWAAGARLSVGYVPDNRPGASRPRRDYRRDRLRVRASRSESTQRR